MQYELKIHVNSSRTWEDILLNLVKKQVTNAMKVSGRALEIGEAVSETRELALSTIQKVILFLTYCWRVYFVKFSGFF